MSYSIPTPDRAYIKLLKAHDNPHGEWFGNTSVIAYGTKGNGMTVFDDMRTRGLLVYVGKNGRRDLYKTSKKGHELVEFAMNFNNLCKFINFAQTINSFPEFKMRVVLEAHIEYTSKNFFDANIYPILNGNPSDLFKKYDGCVDVDKVFRHLNNRLHKISWIDDYIKSMDT